MLQKVQIMLIADYLMRWLAAYAFLFSRPLLSRSFDSEINLYER